MEPFVQHIGLVAPLNLPNVDTDAIVPKQFLKRIERSGFGQFLFYDWRYTEGRANPEFVLNIPRYQGSSILLTRENFGCGSSREHAPWALKDYGFRVVIAPSFAEIFYNNCIKNGMLLIILPSAQIDYLFTKVEMEENYSLTVDLEKNTILDCGNVMIPFQLEEFHREVLLKGLDDIGFTLQQEQKISEYERKRPAWMNRRSNAAT